MPVAEREIVFHADTSTVEAGLERCIALAERFRELWGAAPVPEGFDKVTNVQEGDVIVLRTEVELDETEVAQIKAAADDLFRGCKLAVLSGGIRLDDVIRREDAHSALGMPDDREIGQAAIRWFATRAARGPSSLVGGSPKPKDSHA